MDGAAQRQLWRRHGVLPQHDADHSQCILFRHPGRLPGRRQFGAGIEHDDRATARKTQGGQEILEFGLAAVLLVPMFVGAFVVGMNLIRSIQTNQVCRDLDSMYIHGGDFSTYPLQQEAQRLAQGLNLQIGSSFAGNEQSNTAMRATDWSRSRKMMWIGSTTSANCVAVGASNCTNREQLRIYPADSIWQRHAGQLEHREHGIARCGHHEHLRCRAELHHRLARPLAGQRPDQYAEPVAKRATVTTTALTDGQVAYVVETYFQSPDLSVGSLSGNGRLRALFLLTHFSSRRYTCANSPP